MEQTADGSMTGMKNKHISKVHLNTSFSEGSIIFYLSNWKVIRENYKC